MWFVNRRTFGCRCSDSMMVVSIARPVASVACAMRGDGVPALPAERQTTVRAAIERHLELVDQDRLHERGPGRGQQVHGLVAAKTRTGAEDVAGERFGRILIALADDAALRPERVGLLRRDRRG